MSEGQSWFSTGFDAADHEKQERERRKNTPWRFFLKQNASTEIVFLDDFSKTHQVKLPNGDVIEKPIVPFSLDEHNLTIDGDWKNWMTCLRKVDPPCPLCSAGHRPYYVGMLTVLVKWTDNDNVARWSKRLFAGKLNGIERIRRQLSKKGNLYLCRYEVARTGDRSEVTGDDYEFVERMDPDAVQALIGDQKDMDQKPVTIDPFDYIEMCAPRPKAELEQLLKSGRVAPARSKGAARQQPGPKSQVTTPSNEGGASSNPAEEVSF